MWNTGWDALFRRVEWGRYPPEELVRFVARTYRDPDRAGIRILEIGCGPGANLWFLAREGFAAHGIDGSEVALDRAARRLAKEGLRAALCRGDATRLPYADAVFDGVIDIECLYANEWDDSVRIVAEVRRVLTPGGVFFSKTFMTGTSRDALHPGYGTVRFMGEEEIPALYTGFASTEYDALRRSDLNRTQHVNEWLITCRK